MADIDYDKLADAIRRGSRDDSMVPPARVPGAGAESQFNKTLNAVGGELLGLGKAAVGTTVDGLGKLMQGGAKVSDAFNITAQNFMASDSHIGKAFGNLVKVGGSVVTSLEDSMDMYKSLSVGGASFNNSLVELRLAAAGTRLTLREFGAVIEKNNTSFAKLPGGVTEGAKLFAKASEEMFDKSGLIDRLTTMGYTTQDLNSLLSYTIVNQKRLGLNDEEATKRAIDQAERLAYEMDAVAKITGKSRKEQEDALRKQQEDGQLRAATELAVRKGGAEVKAAFDTMSQAAQVGGPEFAKLQEQMFAMGRPSKDMAEMFAMAGGETQRLMKESAAAAKRGDEALAKRLTLEAAAAYAAQTQKESMLNLAAQGNQAAIKQNASVAQYTDRLTAAAKAEGVDLNTREGRNKAAQRVFEETQRQQKNSGDGVTRTLNAVQNNLNDLSAGVQKGAYSQLKNNEVIGKAFDDYYKTLDQAKGKDTKIREKAEEKTGEALRKLLGAVAGTGASDEKITKAIERGLAMSKEKGTGLTADSAELRALLVFLKTDKSKEAFMATINKAAKEQKMDSDEYLAKVLSQGPAITNKLVEAAQAESNRRYKEEERKARQSPGESMLEDVQRRRKSKQEAEAAGPGDVLTDLTSLATGNGLNVRVMNFPGLPQRQGGSIEATGKLFENFGSGTLAMLHGKEAVLTEAQLSTLLTNFNTDGLSRTKDKNLSASNLSMNDFAKNISKMSMAELPAKQDIKQPASGNEYKEMPKTATLNDVVDSLNNLNRLMSQMISSTVSVADNTARQIKATKGLNGNIYAR